MANVMGATEASERQEEARVTSKVFRRLMWFLLILFVSSYLDRINMGFGALSMNKELGLNATMFGIANSVFYALYVLAEIPSNMAQVRFGARIWIPRIMITWGLASAATAFATGPHSLYVLRALVGLAEAGFMPGILFYMSLWFPPTHRARAAAWYIMGQPITLMFGSLLSGMILDMDGLMGLSGWRWLFLLEGLPAFILGIVAIFYLDDSPAKAKWLSETERAALHRALNRPQGEDRVAARAQTAGGGLVMGLPIVLLGLAYFGLVNSLSANSTWVPQIVRALVPHGSFTQVGAVNAIPSFAAILLMPFWCASSDRKRERTWHFVLAACIAMVGWLIVINTRDPVARMIGLVCCSAGTFSAQSVFWSLTTSYLAPGVRAMGIAIISTIGVSASIFGPTVIGVLRDYTGGFDAGLTYVVINLCMAMLCVLLLAWRIRAAQAALARA